MATDTLVERILKLALLCLMLCEQMLKVEICRDERLQFFYPDINIMWRSFIAPKIGIQSIAHCG
jgi:hypothetical protein